MRINKEGLDLIKKFEGLRLKAYVCPAKKLTIGYGSTWYYDEDGDRRNVTSDMVINESMAEKMLLDNVRYFEELVTRTISVKLNENQFSALVSYFFNIGFSDTMVKLINSGDSPANIYDWWVSHYITAGGVRLEGLVKRREAEADLYFKEVKKK